MPNLGLNYSDPVLVHKDPVTSLPGWSHVIRTAKPLFHLGSKVWSRRGREWVYAKATAPVAVAVPAPGSPITPTPVKLSTSSATVAPGAGFLAWGPFAVDEYGWVESATSTVTPIAGPTSVDTSGSSATSSSTGTSTVTPIAGPTSVDTSGSSATSSSTGTTS
jgi:hypothetical protein